MPKLLPVQKQLPEYCAVILQSFRQKFIRNPRTIVVPQIPEQNTQMVKSLDEMHHQDPYFKQFTWFYFPISQLFGVFFLRFLCFHLTDRMEVSNQQCTVFFQQKHLHDYQYESNVLKQNPTANHDVFYCSNSKKSNEIIPGLM